MPGGTRAAGGETSFCYVAHLRQRALQPRPRLLGDGFQSCTIGDAQLGEGLDDGDHAVCTVREGGRMGCRPVRTDSIRGCAHGPHTCAVRHSDAPGGMVYITPCAA